MILVMDIGNTNIKYGLYDKDNLLHSWRTASNPLQTADELGITVVSFFNYVKVPIESICGIMVSSVIPSINYTVLHMCKLYFNKTPIFVDHTLKTGLTLNYDPPSSLGTDRLCSMVAASLLYKLPAIVIDFGTATTFNVINEKREFLGGTICPSLKISALALAQNTARLPKVELIKPSSPIGQNTEQGVQAGLLYGFIGQVEYILKMLIMQLDSTDISIIATGGMAQLIADECTYDLTLNGTLTLTGLNILYQMNETNL